MKRLHLTVLVIVLCLSGLGLFLYKALALHFPFFPRTQTGIWNLEAKIEFEADGPVRVGLFVPQKSNRFAIMNENFISRGYGVSALKAGVNRQAKWSIRHARGRQTLYYQSVVRQLAKDEVSQTAPAPEPGYHGFDGAYREAAEELISDIRKKSADTETFIGELMPRLAQPATIKKLLNLSSTKLSDEDTINLAVRLLSLAEITARAVHGILLEDQRREVPIIHWLEFYDQNKWRTFDPFTGELSVPENYLIWWRGPEPLLSGRGANNPQAGIAVRLNQEEALFSAIERGKIKQPLVVAFSIFSLPLQTQMVYRVLLLVPIGVFLLIVLRNMVGIKTFGTFMPVLIALAFRETQLLWGLILFSLLVGIGVSIRLYLEHLKLLVIPRLASVLIFVILLMLGISILTHLLGLERGLSVALFPMVILTMTIERASIVWEELGPAEAFIQTIGTLVAAALAYAVMRVPQLEHLVFVFPELLLVILAGTLLMGRYSGYRLIELHRFEALIQNRHAD
jgi:hypothetical protein